MTTTNNAFGFLIACLFAWQIITYRKIDNLNEKLTETRTAIRPPNKPVGAFRHSYSYDPAFPEEGEVWYNSSERLVKIFENGFVKNLSAEDWNNLTNKTLTFDGVPSKEKYSYVFDLTNKQVIISNTETELKLEFVPKE